MKLELTEHLKQTVDALTERYSDKLIEVYQSSGDTFVRVEADANVEICTFLKDELHFDYLTDIFGIDRYTSDERFEVAYNLVSLKHGDRIFLKVRCEEEDPELDSASGVWPAANWAEREVYDMFGIRFRNHPDLRRIYMPEDFQYFPLRKEFPLLGIPGSIELPNTTPDSE
ncbi:NADH-quinone oxidoreductase subunit C [Rhodohalobacter mucosus]|uniref:NADH-quinone oxidoreductase subunit C n=1 Tax=Rhodohalobacter mucosus TaxID=2079485 RepID=A0A316TXL9_9BACT|nr:NADH-quinone oxidoreductase subunit C [Rhodohalobacter mucosus]PWN07422.1 NADH-quinone oxidoreductase subunit C [Rhodohalobacter mucosus]